MASNARTLTLGHHPRSGRGKPAHAPQEEEGTREGRTKKKGDRTKEKRRKKKGRGQQRTHPDTGTPPQVRTW